MNLARRRQKQKVKQVERMMTKTLSPPPTTMASNSNSSNTYSPMSSMSLWIQICASLYVLSGVTQVRYMLTMSIVEFGWRTHSDRSISSTPITHVIVFFSSIIYCILHFILHAPINHCHRSPRKNKRTNNKYKQRLST